MLYYDYPNGKITYIPIESIEKRIEMNSQLNQNQAFWFLSLNVLHFAFAPPFIKDHEELESISNQRHNRKNKHEHVMISARRNHREGITAKESPLYQ